MMNERLTAVEFWLRPCHVDDITKMVSALALVMKTRNWDETTADAIIAAYEIDLSDQPFFAIQDACTAYRRNLVGDGWMPNPGELLTETKKKAQALRAEAVEIRRILDAETVKEMPKAEKSAVKIRVEKLMNELKSARPPNEIARGFAEAQQPDAGLSPLEILERHAAVYKATPIKVDPNLYTRRAAA